MSPTSQEYFARLDRLFQEAVDLPAGDERDEFLKGASGSDPELVQDVYRLLERDKLVREGASCSARLLPRFGPESALYSESIWPKKENHFLLWWQELRVV